VRFCDVVADVVCSDCELLACELSVPEEPLPLHPPSKSIHAAIIIIFFIVIFLTKSGFAAAAARLSVAH